MNERAVIANLNEENDTLCEENSRRINFEVRKSVIVKSGCDGFYAKYIKRVFDQIASLALMPFLALITAIVAPAILLTDGKPVFYNAPRLGYKGKEFIMYKFRSMKQNPPDIRLADGTTYNSAEDPRQTKIGAFLRRTSIDELPQILNVLIGNMSFVGPRPDFPEHRRNYEGNEVEKLNVKPGVTGFSQAYYRNTIAWKERLKNDVYYVNNITLLMDLKIIAHTVIAVARRENVYVKQQAPRHVRRRGLY